MPDRDHLSRLLGHRDGMATAVIALRNEIGRISHPRIPAHHKRKLAEREKLLAPLRRLLARFLEECASNSAAYKAQSEPQG